MLSQLLQRRLTAPLRRRKPNAASSRPASRTGLQQRWITPAPRPGDGPLLSRRADRQLPEVSQVRFRWGRSLPVFLAIIGVCSVAIFNYQKTSSPVVASTLYALRKNARARDILGDDVYFKHQIPWIGGEMNQMQGRINIHFTVRGTRGWATMRFASHRPGSRSLFQTTEWSLTTQDGEWVDLLEGGDPFKGLLGGDGLVAGLEGVDDVVDAHALRGFRQQGVLNK
ncbi:uncharacterized protein UV8b_01326 [Ustilaginoidea virens]|uniref:Cytochrome oxidase complex assembly protein n=1 Tax=Ustilaginoidea virens TaxID=1159556 RepID=A0A8E5HKS4_USTVR|nr:uncharacterized protein UV8b_01326 [Ustilaginoidea virens]QUC17085.1 hypothetical protein UV8b_01326 [Ustilaginoidea virens]